MDHPPDPLPTPPLSCRSDKTGTLTKNEMTAVSVRIARPGAAGCLRATGSGYNVDGDVKCGDEPLLPAERALLRQLLLPAALCNDATLMPTVSAVAQHMIVHQTLAVPLPSTLVPVNEGAEEEGGAAAAAADATAAAEPAPSPAPGDAALAAAAAPPAAAAAASPPAPAETPSALPPSRRTMSTHLAQAPGAPVASIMGRTLPPDPPAAPARASQKGGASPSRRAVPAAAVAATASGAAHQAASPALASGDAPSPTPDATTAVATATAAAAPEAVALTMDGGAGGGGVGGDAYGSSGGRIEWNSTGDPTEVALLALAMKAGLNLRTLNALFNECPRIDTVPL